ncbi:ABC transporter ATP-binding protein [Lentzea sp. CC55]|uniref:ABC transporter ATP-binding protein n=1 Tax=Lentzea sp. CC55 TaxID=2884909 RepID=UPI0027E00FE0|nr:oligopeptide/dipeptide ABC transporter ATP-binding protein [Lentzea sp. CC55]MCG8927911.1 ABC transporter ATP-binding protein [Lentzea sp. CC55]
MVNLEIDRVSVRFALKGATVEAVNDVSLRIRPGECVALVGESGCGKTVLASALLGFLPGNAETSGSARLGDVDLLAAGDRELATTIRGRRIGLIPQSPASHLTPVRTARSQLEEAARVLGGDARKAAERAGLLPEHLDRYPHELSGGMAQRVANALALVGNPPLLIADEPTTGLDRDLVDGLLGEFRRLVDEGHSVLLITHDLAAAHRVADRIAVMYAGRIVEVGPAHAVLDNSRHPYARGLANALPERDFLPVPGQPPLLTDLPAGCAFAPRCGQAAAVCEDRPVLTDDPHAVACHRPC